MKSLWLALGLAGGMLVAAPFGQQAHARAARYGTATVYLDTYGVPHIFGPTDASVIYASAWVQANADWPLVEKNFIRATGRAAEFLGEASLADDYLDRALGIPQLARQEYAHESPQMRALLDAFAAGFNDWLAAHPKKKHWLGRVEPWFALALMRFKYDQVEFLGYSGFHKSMEAALLKQGWPVGPHRMPAVSAGLEHTDLDSGSIVRFAENIRGPFGGRPIGSNEWAVGPSRTASGRAMLLINPHQAFFGIERYFEIDLHSAEGLVFSGLTRFGFLLPYMGNNGRLGWTFTNNYPDIGDLYVERFDDPAHPLAYRYGNRPRSAETWTETIKVKTGDTIGTRTLRFWKTHHGPIVGLDKKGRPMAAQLAKLKSGGWDDQLYAMIRSRTFEAFRAAELELNIPYMNLMYADVAGNIWYVYNGAVPRRDPSFDWRKPVDGSDPRTEWHGYHALSELPQVRNPKSGFLLNCNSSPMFVTDAVPYTRKDFPSYMIGNETDNPRARSSRRVLAGFHKVTFDRFARAVWDTRLSAADRLIPQLVSQWKKMKAAPAASVPKNLRPGTDARRDVALAIERLRHWNRVARIESVETTWFVFSAFRWHADEVSGAAAGRFSMVEDLAEELRVLRARWDTIEVPWGMVTRIQRPPSDDPADFSDSLPSLPVGGAPGALGSVFTLHRYHSFKETAAHLSAPSRYGIFGNSFLKVVEFAPHARARSVEVFGQSADPKSPHFFDQAPLYAARMFKPAWSTLAEVKAHAVTSYRPGRR